MLRFGTMNFKLELKGKLEEEGRVKVHKSISLTAINNAEKSKEAVDLLAQ